MPSQFPVRMASRPVIHHILSRIQELEKSSGIKRTVLAVCPNSVSVIDAALRSAKRWNAPIKFTATLNQVDRDGGYTGMTHAELVRVIREKARRIHYEGPVSIAVDHGGPWLKDRHVLEKWSESKAMDWVRQAFTEAVHAGYDLIHVDCTADAARAPDQAVSIEQVVERTIELIVHAEKIRRESDRPPIAYEVGTEEVHGGLTDMNILNRFLRSLKKRLAEENLPDVWPCFVVANVGTDLHTTTFDTNTARRLAGIAGKYGSFIKGHYTDNVINPEDYPLSGMGGANVGPEFSEKEYEALMELAEREEELVARQQIERTSNLKNALWRAVIKSDRWRKWLIGDEKGKSFSELAPERQDWLLRTGARYVWNMPDVLEERRRLYENLQQNGIDPEAIVMISIERSMDKYFRAFHLAGLNPLIGF